MRKTKTALIGAAAASFLLVLAGCSSSDDTAASESASPIESPTTEAPVSPTSPSASPTTSTTSPTASPTNVLCTETAILDAIPDGSKMVRFDCAQAGDEYWAATEVKPGPTLFFLRDDDSAWTVETADAICGTASAALPEKILDYCDVLPPR
jgi:hypothetical protein